MIGILNINMAVDKTFYIPDFKKGLTFRKNPDISIAGGKGVNVARVIKNFTNDYMLFGLSMGFQGKNIIKKLKEEKIKSKIFWDKNGESRVCITIVDKYGISTDLNEEGGEANDSVLKKMFSTMKKNFKRYDKICVSGRTIKGADERFYKELVTYCSKNRIESYIDITGKYLEVCMLSGADNVKINAYEFEEFCGMKSSLKNIKKIYFKYRAKGLKRLVITDKENPALAVIDDVVYEIIPPKIKNFVSGVGAGDSFMAGFIYSIGLNKNIIDVLRFAVACACSDCVSLGAGIINKNDLNYFRDKVYIKKLEDL